MKIDSGLAETLLKNSQYLASDSLAHAYEHSLEVELPFLQYYKSHFEIVPIAFMSSDVAALKKVGEEIAAVLQDPARKGSVMLVASSDMTHYEAQEAAQKKDKEAIDAILALDPDRLAERIRRHNISMCGFAPAIVMLQAAKRMGATGARLVKYQTSGDVTGDTSSVVGYAGILVY